MKQTQQQSARLDRHLLGIQLSDVLDMPELEYRRWVSSIEADPLFAMLRRPGRGRAVVRRQPWGRFRFAELLSDPADPRPSGSPAWEAPSPEVQNAIRRAGQDNFERYFLYNPDNVGLPEAAEKSGLTPDEARRIQEFLDRLDLAHGGGPAETPAPAASASRVASIGLENGEPLVFLLTPHYARGRYVIDYDELKRLKDLGALPLDQWGKVQDMVRRMELANRKQTALAGLLQLITREQKKYFLKGQALWLRALSQREAAQRLQTSPSAVCRALQGRSVRTPWGEEQALKFFFPSQKELALYYVQDILSRHPKLTDRALLQRLKHDRGLSVSVRCVNLYRHVARRRGLVPA
jgi:hypothetical protein